MQIKFDKLFKNDHSCERTASNSHFANKMKKQARGKFSQTDKSGTVLFSLSSPSVLQHNERPTLSANGCWYNYKLREIRQTACEYEWTAVKLSTTYIHKYNNAPEASSAFSLSWFINLLIYRMHQTLERERVKLLSLNTYKTCIPTAGGNLARYIPSNSFARNQRMDGVTENKSCRNQPERSYSTEHASLHTISDIRLLKTLSDWEIFSTTSDIVRSSAQFTEMIAPIYRDA